MLTAPIPAPTKSPRNREIRPLAPSEIGVGSKIPAISNPIWVMSNARSALSTLAAVPALSAPCAAKEGVGAWRAALPTAFMGEFW